MDKRFPVVLVILDGWGEAPPGRANPIVEEELPFWSAALRLFPYTTLRASGNDVGLPHGQAGNSEAGHMNLGAGRIVDQDAVVISKSIANGSFMRNPAFLKALSHIKKTGGNLHLMGIVSGKKSPHMDPDHVIALVAFARASKVKKVYLHAFTDGRDSYYKAGATFIRDVERIMSPPLEVVTIMGRLYLDRKKNWERTLAAYRAMVLGLGTTSRSAVAAVTEAYSRGETDEFIKPTVIVNGGGKPQGRIRSGDAVIFYNLRSDRARQLAKIFVQKNFEIKNPGAPKRGAMLKNLFFVAMTDFGPDLDSIATAFPSRSIHNSLPMCFQGLRQLYLAETEKYAHITYFFNGGYAAPVAKEDREVFESPSVDSYRGTPAMRVPEITDRIVTRIEKYDFIAANFASPDMIGHTGDMRAAKKALRIVDTNLLRLERAVVSRGGTLIVTADHGNIEEMLESGGLRVDTSHSVNPVPFLAISRNLKGKRARKYRDARLADVAPTILGIMGIPKPPDMTGRNLL